MRQKGEHAGQVVGKGDGLRRLRMGVPGHQRVEMAARLHVHDPAQRQQLLAGFDQPAPQRHARQCVSQVVAAAPVAGCRRRLPRHFDDPSFDAKEQVLDARQVGVCCDTIRPQRRHRVHNRRRSRVMTPHSASMTARLVRLQHRLKASMLGRLCRQAARHAGYRLVRESRFCHLLIPSDCRQRNPFDDLPLEEEKDDQQWHGGQAGAGHDHFPFGRGLAARKKLRPTGSV